MQKFTPGQRWVSDSEPELGLGVVLEAAFRQVRIEFPAAEETRVYRVPGAPLRRARLAPGDRARARSGAVMIVERVEERDDLLTYHGGGMALPEGDLLDRMSFSDPEKRLLAGQVGKPRAFDLRVRTLALQRNMLGARVRGLAGARMELLPHQIAIAHEVASRHNPRVLLADEVGLGKTIEAGLVFQRLYATGQISRVLVVAPSQLVHQWMVELYRRFHYLFTVLDEEFCRAEEKGDATRNPFALRSLMLCPIDFLAAPASGARRVRQAVEAGIDLLIVDEAHHLQWSEDKVSAEYAAVEALARIARGVLLLTATPIQLGQAGHFGRLRLLDPGRFTNLQAYLEETRHYEELARLADALLSSDAPQADVAAGLRALYPDDAVLGAHLGEYLAAAPGRAEGDFRTLRDRLVQDLVDRHGTGRLMFRNRRQAMGGFPGRVVHPVALDPASGRETSREPSSPAKTPAFVTASDPRLAWLVAFLHAHPDDKVLLITSRKEDVFALQEILPSLTTVPFVSFHENLTMTTRDKNAAWFAQPDGARMLVCSEIGSEGRNFQFAKHLVLFDLPPDPGVLEQRIGRLDRIGRKGDVHIQVPYVRNTAHEVLFRWYHEGFDAFRHTVLGADAFHELLQADLEAAMAEATEAAVTALIAKTRATAEHVRATLEKGRDRLLEIHGNRTALAEELIAEIHEADADPTLEAYLDEVFDHFGLDAQETAVTRGYLVLPGERMVIDAFPGIPEEGLPLTYDRGEALAREEMAFISPDHPLVRTAVDLVMENEDGRSVFVAWPTPPAGVRRGFALEAVFVLAATAPGSLHLDRFLPPTPVRVMVDGEGESLGGVLPALDKAAATLSAAPTGLLEEHHTVFERLIPGLLEAARERASVKVSQLKREAHREAETRLVAEAERLKALSAVNPAVTAHDVETAERHARTVMDHIAGAELRLDSVRLVMLGDMDL